MHALTKLLETAMGQKKRYIISSNRHNRFMDFKTKPHDNTFYVFMEQ